MIDPGGLLIGGRYRAGTVDPMREESPEQEGGGRETETADRGERGGGRESSERRGGEARGKRGRRKEGGGKKKEEHGGFSAETAVEIGERIRGGDSGISFGFLGGWGSSAR